MQYQCQGQVTRQRSSKFRVAGRDELALVALPEFELLPRKAHEILGTLAERRGS